jgi:hypothetical protein
MKPKANKLIINKPLDRNNGFYAYVFNWMFEDTLLIQEIRLVEDSSKSFNELFDINDLIQHKIQCCLEIDTTDFNVNEVLMEQ